MNTRLKKSFGWYTGLVYQGQFMINHYNVELSLITVSADHVEQNIAYDRMKHWMYHVMDDCVFIHDQDPELSKWAATKSRLIVLPEEPVDQIIGIMLYLKLNAIMENRMVIAETEVWSTHGDQTSYLHSVGESLGATLGQDGWWTDPRPTWWNTRPREDGNIVSLDRVPEWKDHDLDWSHRDKDEDQSVIFAKFGKDADE